MTNVTTYYLQKTKGGFDRVDQKVFSTWSRAVDRNEQPLYTGIGFISAPTGPVILGNPTWVEFAQMCRVMGVKGLDGVVPGGIYQEPEFVRIRPVRGRTQVYEINRNPTSDM